LLVADRKFLSRSRLHAATGRGNRLTRIAESARVKEVSDLPHLLQVLLPEEVAHEGELFDADPVLARQAAAHAADELEDVLARLADAVDHALLALVVQDDRMEVAVARVEHVGDDDPLLLLDLVDLVEHFGQLRARNDAVVGVVVGREAPERAERLLAALPELRPFRLVL